MSAGRLRGLAGLLQGSQGSPTWSLLAQAPLWVGIVLELRRSCTGLVAFGVHVPPKAWSDDWTMLLPPEAPLTLILAVFGAICVDSSSEHWHGLKRRIQVEFAGRGNAARLAESTQAPLSLWRREAGFARPPGTNLDLVLCCKRHPESRAVRAVARPKTRAHSRGRPSLGLTGTRLRTKVAQGAASSVSDKKD